jgi:hypothetical protein
MLFYLGGSDRPPGCQKKKRKTMLKEAKYILAAVLVGAVAAGCARIEVEERERNEELVPVTFTTYSQRTATKANPSFVGPGADFATGAVVGVFGYYHDACTFATDPSNIADFMYNTPLRKQSDGSWTYSPIKYWPNEYGTGANSTNVDKLSFWGYYPRGTSGLDLYKSGTTTAYDNNSAGIPKAHFTVSSEIPDQVDLMFSTPLYDLYKNDASHHGELTGGEVTLVFRHALSLIQFNVTSNGSALPAGAEIEITELTLTNVKTEGTCNNPAASITSVAEAEAFWTSVGTPVTIELPLGADSDSNLILMPQELAEQGSTGHSTTKLTITFNYSFPAADDPTAKITYTDNTVDAYLWSDTAVPAYGVKRWLPGRKYVYNVEAGLEKIEFSEVFTETWTLQSQTNL